MVVEKGKHFAPEVVWVIHSYFLEFVFPIRCEVFEEVLLPPFLCQTMETHRNAFLIVGIQGFIMAIHSVTKHGQLICAVN